MIAMNTRFKTNLSAIVGLFFLVISCSPTPDATVDSLSQAQKCMEAYPDSALRILQNIPFPENLHGKAQADYALLMTQAMHKNDLKYTSDSLISIALGYYGAYSMDPVAEGKAFFYYGKVMQSLDSVELAMKYYLKAKSILDETKEYKTLGLIAEGIGNLNRKQKLIDEALKSFHASLLYYTSVKDSSCISFAYRNIARSYIGKQNVDSALFYYNQALYIANQKKYPLESSILRELGGIYRSANDYNKAEYYFLTSVEKAKNDEDFYCTHLSLGYLYAQLNFFEKAESTLKECLNSKDNIVLKDAYECLYHLERKKDDLPLAVLYKDKADSLLEITHNSETQAILAELQQKYKNEKLQKENLQVKTEKQNSQFIGAIFVFVISIIGGYYYLGFRNNRKRIKEISKQIAENEVEIRRLEKEIEEYQTEYSKVEESNKSRISELTGEMTLLVKQNRKLIDHLEEIKKGITPKEDSKLADYLAGFRMVFQLRAKDEKVTVQWDTLYSLANFLYQEFVNRLQEEYAILTKHDIEICVLIKFGCTNEVLSNVFHTTIDSVNKAKKRLKNRLGLSSEDNLDDFIRRY